MEIVLGIGTNLGDRIDYITKAITAIKDREILTEIKFSKIYESKALLPQDAPDSWNQNFLNMAIKGKSLYSPEKLLSEIKDIERKLGRRDRGFWSPREIDVDILVYGNCDIVSDKLTIPHYYLLERAFVLLPLNDVWSEWIYPRQGVFKGKKVSELLRDNPVDKGECWVTEYNVKIDEDSWNT